MRRKLLISLVSFTVLVTVGAGAFVWNAKKKESEWRELTQDAKDLSGQGKYKAALVVAQRALTVAEQTMGESHPNVATSLIQLAALYQNQGQFAQAEPLLKRALEIDEKASGAEHPDVAVSLDALAALYNTQGKYSLAEPLFKRALEIRQTALGPSHPLVAASLDNLGLLYINQGLYAKAEPLLMQSLKIKETSGNVQADIPATLTSLGMLYYSQGQYEQAERYYKQALNLREAALGKDHPEVAQSLHSLGMLYYTQGNYAQAEPFDKRALVTYEKAFGPEHPEVAKSLNNLAELYRIQGLYALAEPLLLRALAISEKALGKEHSEVATTLNNLALLYRNQGQYAKAEPLLQRALAIDEKVSGLDHPHVAASLNNLALLHQIQGAYDKALPLYERSLAIREKALGPDHPDVARSLNNLAELHKLSKRPDLAEPLLQRSLAIFGKAHGPDHPRLALSHYNLSAVYEQQGKSAEALEQARRATAIYRQRIVFGGATDMADTSVREASQNRSGFAQHLALLARTGGKESPAALADEAFQVVQLDKATGTAAAIAKMAARFAKGDDALAALVKKKQDAVSSRTVQEARLVAAASKPPSERKPKDEEALQQALAAADKDIAAIDAELSERFPEYQQLTRPEPLAITRIQELLKPGEAMLVYSFGEAGKAAKDKAAQAASYAWVVGPRQARFLPLKADAREVAAQVQKLRNEMDFDDDGKAMPVSLDALYDLYQRVFAPVAPHLAGVRHVMVVPDGALDSLPLGMLVASPPPKAKADYRQVDWLIKRYALSILPAVGSIRAFRQYAKSGKAPGVFAGFGDPLIGEGAPPAASAKPPPLPGVADVDALRKAERLAETADELAAMAQALKTDSSAIWLRDKATETQVKQMDLSQFRTVAFATHGVMAGQMKGMDEAGLILTPPAAGTLTDDGYLSTSEIARLKLNADWVILSACNTAAPDGTPGAEGLSGLAKAFFYAGSRSLLVSHWPVASEATVPLTTAMLNNYEARPQDGKAEAHRKAVLALMATPGHAEYSHPVYWAPFVVVGEGGAGNLGEAKTIAPVAAKEAKPAAVASAPPESPAPPQAPTKKSAEPPPAAVDARRAAIAAAQPKRAPGVPLEVEPKAIAGLPDVSFEAAYFLQFGAFSVKANAEAVVEKLKADPETARRHPFIRMQGKLNLVHAGPWNKAADARLAIPHMTEVSGIAPIIVSGALEPTNR